MALVIFLMMSSSAIMAGNSDSLPAPRQSFGLQSTNIRSDLAPYLQYGFRIGTDFNISDRQISEWDHLDGLFTATFGFYARGGYRFIFGEIGLHYMFYKGTYTACREDMQPIGTETVESRYLQIPISVVGYWEATRIFALIPKVGITYQPLLQVTRNDIGYSKKNFARNQCLLHAGIGFKVKFLTVDVAYKYALKPFFSNKESTKQSFINLSLGFQF